METIKHTEMVTVLAKSGEAILASLTPRKCQLIHAALGICSEAGELATAVKAHIAYDKPLDMPNVVEESGDLEFFLEHFRQILALARQDILDGNIAKLRTRYEGFVYSDKAAIARADKNMIAGGGVHTTSAKS